MDLTQLRDGSVKETPVESLLMLKLLAQVTYLQALDVVHNQLHWDENQGELSRAVAVLRVLKRLRVLSLRGNPTCAQPGYRGWVLANAPRLEVFDEQPVSAEERRGVAPAEHSRTEAARSLLSDDGAAEARVRPGSKRT